MTPWPRNVHVRPIQAWPGSQTAVRERSQFSADWTSTLNLLTRELSMLGARNTVLQVAMTESDFRNDGYPRANAKATHPGVILSFDTRHGSLSFPCDRFTTWQDNLRAIALAMEALRKVDRYGVTRNGEQYTGWRAIGSGSATQNPTAIPSHDQALLTIARLSAEKPGHFDADRDLTRYRENPNEIRRDWRKARALHHPDRKDGDRTTWDLIQTAARVLGLE